MEALYMNMVLAELFRNTVEATLIMIKLFARRFFFITNLYLHAKHLLHIGSKKYYRRTDSRIRPKITGVLIIVSQPAIMHSPRHSVLNNGDEYTIAGLINLHCGAGNFGKIWSACRQHEI